MFRLCDHREQFHSVVARIDKKKITQTTGKF